jgi:hypothetical protein
VLSRVVKDQPGISAYQGLNPLENQQFSCLYLSLKHEVVVSRASMVLVHGNVKRRVSEFELEWEDCA